MPAKRLAVSASVLFFMAITSTQARFLHGSIPTFEGANWHEVLERVACQYVTRDGKDLTIAAKLVVDGKTFQNPTITEEGQIKELEKRCFPKG
jgi:hypothetical protein